MDFRDGMKILLVAAVLAVPMPGAAGELLERVYAGDRAGVEAALAGGASLEEVDIYGYTPLLQATQDGNVELVSLLLARGANPNAVSKTGYTPLHAAADKGNVAIIDLLLAKGASLNAREQYRNWTPLHRALTQNRNAAIARLIAAGAGVDALIAPGANANASEEGGMKALHYAARTGNQVLVEAVLARGADIKAVDGDKRTALHYAARSGNLALVQWLVARGLDVNADAGYYGRPIHAAAQSGNKALVEWLVTKGADAKAVDGFGRSVLFQAATSGNRLLVEWLVARGAATNGEASYYGTVLQSAAATGNLELVQYLAAHGADAKAPDKNGNSVLHYAARSGNLALVQWLVARGGDVNARNENDYTPLHEAITSRNTAVVAWLVQQGADVNRKAKYYGTPVTQAVVYGKNRDMLDLLLKAGASLKASEGPALCAAASKADPSMFRWLVAQGLDIHATDDHGDTPLHVAAASGILPLTEWLLAHGADIAATNKNGDTPLHAAMRSDGKTAELLLAKGADVNAANNDGETPMHVAAWADRPANIAVLRAHGARVDARNKKGQTPLHRAAYYNRAQVITALLAAGADINAKDNDGKTPFLVAIGDGKPDVIAALVKGGADVKAADGDGKTPLMTAAYSGDKALVQVLLDAGSDVNARASDGSTPLLKAVSGGKAEVLALLLDRGAAIEAKGGYYTGTALHQAAADGKLDMVQLLLARGADVNALDKDGETPLHRAAYAGRAEVVRALLVAGAKVGILDSGKHSALYEAVAYGERDPVIAGWLLAGGRAAYGDYDESFTDVLRYDRTPLVKAFLDHGASASAPLADGRLPLAIAAYPFGTDKDNDPKGTVALLVSRGADVNARDKDGDTALHVAARSGKPGAVEALLAAGADVNAKGQYGRTPLHEAARISDANTAAVQALLAHGADVNARTDESQGAQTPIQMTDSIADAGVRQEVVALLQQAAIKRSGSPRETLKQMLADFRGHVANETLRRSIVQLAGSIKPALAVPADAEKANARARYLFRTAESEDDYLEVATQYLQAIEAAPWVPDYYFNLCVILEKTQYVKQALHACRLYLEVAPATAVDDIAKIKALLSGVEFAQEKSIAKMRGRTLYYGAVDMQGLYEVGGASGTVAGQELAVKATVDWKAAPPKYQVMVACLQSTSVWTDTFDLVDTDTTVSQCGKSFHLVIKAAGEGFVDLSDWSGNGSIRSSIDGLFEQRRKALAQSPVYAGCEYGEKTVCRTYVGQMQGGRDKTVAGTAYYESDCVGNLLRKDVRALPNNFVTLADVEGYSGNSGNFRYVAGAGEGAYGQQVEELRACTDRFNSAVGSAYKDWGKDEK